MDSRLKARRENPDLHPDRGTIPIKITKDSAEKGNWMQRPKIWLYLHHVELGQRYPVSESVVIGREAGEILFPKDDRLSARHCQIFQDEKGQVQIRDLESSNGTVVDGRLLSPQKTYPLRDGTMISVGHQAFKCVEPSNKPFKPIKKKRKKKKAGLDLTPFFAVIFAAAAGALIWNFRANLRPVVENVYQLAVTRMTASEPQAEEAPAPPLKSPFELVYKEVEAAYGEYRQIGADVESGKLAGKEMAFKLRQKVIPMFVAANEKLSVLKPSNEWERRRIEANSRLVNSITRQLKAMASYAETKHPKYADAIEKATPDVKAASEEARKLNDPRAPAGSQL